MAIKSPRKFSHRGLPNDCDEGHIGFTRWYVLLMGSSLHHMLLSGGHNPANFLGAYSHIKLVRFLEHLCGNLNHFSRKNSTFRGGRLIGSDLSPWVDRLSAFKGLNLSRLVYVQHKAFFFGYMSEMKSF